MTQTCDSSKDTNFEHWLASPKVRFKNAVASYVF